MMLGGATALKSLPETRRIIVISATKMNPIE
jgi:hypothetical protein